MVVSSSTGLHWVLPQGHIEEGETPEAAALRELQEETGMCGEIIAPLSVQEFQKFTKEVVARYFLVRMAGLVNKGEGRLLRWEEESAALTLLSFVTAQDALREGAEILRHIH